MSESKNYNQPEDAEGKEKDSGREVGAGVRPLVTETNEDDGRDKGASSGQKGQPGIPGPDEEEWSPGSPQANS
ncbi:MAG: hypothetical protein H7070_15325 [Saprospiraceae bacterium]|nr:hypothetical protein [Pyrinomonadaceae bacterium]